MTALRRATLTEEELLIDRGLRSLIDASGRPRHTVLHFDASRDEYVIWLNTCEVVTYSTRAP
jgi:hypothetical protein